MTGEQSHNPYFNRWFSAILIYLLKKNTLKSHNPYFNRWFSAMNEDFPDRDYCDTSQSLF